MNTTLNKMEKSFDFKKDEKVYAPHFSKKKKLTISGVKMNVVGLHMIAFKGEKFCCSENYVKRDLLEPDKTISECIDYYGNTKAYKTNFNTICMGFNTSPDTGDNDNEIFDMLDVQFFQPHFDTVKFIASCAQGKMILEVGCGGGHLLKYLQSQNCKVFGIEPYYNPITNFSRQLSGRAPNIHIIPKRVEDCGNLIKELKDKVLVVVAPSGPCDFVEDTISLVSKGVEVLYINQRKYVGALGKYKSKAKIVKEDVGNKNEVIYSIIK